MKKIKLSDGQTSKVDNEDYPWLIKFAWHPWWNPRTQGIHAVTYKVNKRTGKKEMFLMENVIMNPLLRRRLEGKDEEN